MSLRARRVRRRRTSPRTSRRLVRKVGASIAPRTCSTKGPRISFAGPLPFAVHSRPCRPKPVHNGGGSAVFPVRLPDVLPASARSPSRGHGSGRKHPELTDRLGTRDSGVDGGVRVAPGLPEFPGRPLITDAPEGARGALVTPAPPARRAVRADVRRRAARCRERPRARRRRPRPRRSRWRRGWPRGSAGCAPPGRRPGRRPARVRPAAAPS